MKSFIKFLLLLPLFLSAPVFGKNFRIAVIGAGMSGLSAGHYLKKKGFERVTIFEKEEEIGGKVLSKKLNGSLYDLGAVWVFKEYATILEMVRELKVPLKRFPGRKTVLDGGNRLLFLDYGLQKFNFFEILEGLIRAKEVLAKYSYLKNPGFTKVSPELFDSFEDFVQKNNLDSIKYITEPFLVGTGYGYSGDVPAMYILKPTIMIFESLVEDIINEYFGIPSDAFQFFPGGFQSFLKVLAQNLEVKTSEAVLKIVRENGEVKIQTSKGNYTFDRVFISTPPDATLKFLDATEDEKFFLSQMQFNYYQITAFKGKRLPKHEVMFLAKSIDENNRGVPAVIANWGKTNNVWISLCPYDFRSGPISPEVLRAKLEEEVNSLGGEVEEILFDRGLTYFFHYSSDFLNQNSPYEKLESMQGNLGTYFIGGAFNFESVEHTAQYAKEVVKKYFK